jgi:hypothetical protein
MHVAVGEFWGVWGSPNKKRSEVLARHCQFFRPSRGSVEIAPPLPFCSHSVLHWSQNPPASQARALKRSQKWEKKFFQWHL